MSHRILFISSWFPNKLEPTNGNFVQRHAEAVKLYNEVEILHAIGDFNQKEKYLVDEKMVNGIKTVIVYYKNTKNPILNFYRRMKAYNLGYTKVKRPQLVHANVLHNNMLFAVHLKSKFKIPFVVTEHWTALRSINHEITPKSVKKTAWWIGSHASKILPVSADLKKGLEQLGIKTAMEVVPNVVNTRLFQPRYTKNEIFTFVHVSNLIPRKNADKILNVAIKLLKEGYKFKLQLGGDGDISNLNKIAEESGFGDAIEIFGMQTLEQVSSRMKASDAFILFSDDENQPCVIAEAFSSGLKVISTSVGGIAEFFPEDAGILLNSRSEEELENAMIQLLKEGEVNNAMSLSQYADATFSKETIGKKYTEIYDGILNKA